MGQVIEFRTLKKIEIRPEPAPEGKCRCSNCGADLWHIRGDGELCCADCEAVCPYRLQRKNEY